MFGVREEENDQSGCCLCSRTDTPTQLCAKVLSHSSFLYISLPCSQTSVFNTLILISFI